MSDHKNDVLFVTGAAGKLGGLVVEELLKRGATKVIAGTRQPEKLKALVDRGIAVRRIDFDEPATLASAFEGVDRLLIISTDSLGVAGQRIEQHRAAIAAAVKAGVKHVAYTSAPSARPSAGGGVLDDHFRTESALYESPMGWSILRNAFYTDLIPVVAGSALETGKLFSATAGKGKSYVTREDCAAAAAGALLTAEGQTIYDITGPEAVTQDSLAELLTEITGKAVKHTNIPAEALFAGMTGAGVPASLAQVLVSFDNDTAEGRHEVVTTSVEELSGRKAISVEEHLRGALKK
jgi:NAD(P)H dehydrogenase (quinone)